MLRMLFKLMLVCCHNGEQVCSRVDVPRYEPRHGIHRHHAPEHRRAVHVRPSSHVPGGWDLEWWRVAGPALLHDAVATRRAARRLATDTLSHRPAQPTLPEHVPRGHVVVCVCVCVCGGGSLGDGFLLFSLPSHSFGVRVSPTHLNNIICCEVLSFRMIYDCYVIIKRVAETRATGRLVGCRPWWLWYVSSTPVVVVVRQQHASGGCGTSAARQWWFRGGCGTSAARQWWFRGGCGTSAARQWWFRGGFFGCSVVNL